MEFYAHSPYGSISCGMYDGYAGPPVAFCESVRPAAKRRRHSMPAELNGVLCTSATTGITCVKVAEPGKGKGFRVNKSEAVEVG